MSDEVVTEILHRCEPQRKEDKTAHQRSGKTRQIMNIFNNSTQQFLADVLGDCLQLFGYNDEA